MGDGNAGKTARLASRARHGGAVHRGLLLEVDADTASRGVLDRLLGLVDAVVVLETVNEEQSGYGERASLSAGADTTANTRGGALQMGDLRLLEDGSERGGALVSDGVVVETAGQERSKDGESMVRK